MNKEYFQVNVEKATPACGCDCPNLQINVDDVFFDTCSLENKQNRQIRSRTIRCVNDSYCRRLYEVMKENKSKE